MLHQNKAGLRNKHLIVCLNKAGYKGKLDDVKDNFSLLRRYQSVKFGLSYEDYLEKYCDKVGFYFEYKFDNNFIGSTGF